MHDDWTISTEATITDRQEREVSNFHTRDEAIEAGIHEHAEALAAAIRADPESYITAVAVHEPDDGR